jgi:quercetin dioxygenase-like cupin family protein
MPPEFRRPNTAEAASECGLDGGPRAGEQARSGGSSATRSGRPRSVKAIVPFNARPWKCSEESTMSNEQVAPETRGVTVKLLATVDLGPEIEGMAGRQLRMRMVTIEPGGVFGPIHDHKGRPGTVYILQGTITDHRSGFATDYGPGVGWPEDRNTTHWLENRGTIPAVEISVDIVRQE